MIRKPVVLITGAGGEIGHGLIAHLAAAGNQPVITLDVNPLEPALGKMVQREFTGSIMDKPLLERVLSEFEVATVYHLAALLSTRSEFTPVTAHQINVEGTLNLLEFSQHEAESHGQPVTFLYPSSIAAYASAASASGRSSIHARTPDWTAKCIVSSTSREVPDG